MNDYLLAALARERHNTLLAEAAAFRRARQARTHQQTARDTARATRRWRLRWRLVHRAGPVDRDAGMSTRLANRRTAAPTGRPADHRLRQVGERVKLRDGLDVLIRPVRHDDAALLVDGFDRLGAQSRQFRFLTAKNYLSPSELCYLTDIDHHNHEALGALDPVDGRGLGVARYIRAADNVQAAEIAVTIVDEWQGRGLGSELLTRLTGRALGEGIRRFTALVAADNQAVVALLRSLPGDLVLVGHGHGALEYEISLERPQQVASLPSGRTSATR